MSKILANQIANYGDDAPIEIKEGLNIPAGKPIQAAGSAGSAGQVLSTTGTSIAWVATFDGDYNSLSNKPTIPAAQINSDWNATSGVGVILNKPVVPPQSSVTTAAAGTAALSYNSTNGEFTFTPPDLSGYLTSYTETDPVFAASDAAAVTAAKISNWDTAYGWGNHASAGYLTSYTETQTLDNVLALGATTTRDITTTGKVYFSNNFATTGDLPNATTYHGMFAHVHAEGHGYFAHAGAWTQLLDTGSSIGDLADVNLAVAPQSGQVLAYDGSNWVATAAGGGGGGIALTDLSVSTASAGTAALSYNNVSGVFTYTPPDLSSYAQTANLSIANWDSAYGWGDHALAGYATETWVNGRGYLTAEADTLATVTGRGATTTDVLSVGGISIGTDTNSAGSDPAKSLTLGDNDEFKLFYRASATFTTTMVTGAILDIRSTTSNTDKMITCQGNGVVQLYYSGSSKLSTSNTGVDITGTLDTDALVAGGLTYPTTNGTSGYVLTSDGAGNVTWAAPTGGSGGANVTISDTIPAGTPASGDLWWESDTGRLKIYYQDTDSSQWVDTNPPLADATSIGGSGTVAMLASLIPDVNDAYDLGSAEYKIRDIYEADPSDARLKTDVVDYTGGLAFVESLRVVDFTWKEDVDVKAGKRETGLIAQEVKEALDASNYNSWRLHTDGDLQGVDKKQLIPALISAIQELSARVKELENK